MSSAPFQPPPFHPARPHLVAPVRVDPSGAAGPSPTQVGAERWRRSSRGLYVPGHLDPALPEQRIVEAAALLPAYGGVTGWAALRWAGGRWFGGLAEGGHALRPVTLAIGGNVRSRPGVQICEEGLDPRDLTEIDGLRITTLVRAVCFEVRYARDVRRGVLALDMAAHDDLVSVDEAAEYAATLGTWTGIPCCREALGLASENSWSPQESLMRLIWVLDANRPRPLCNVPIFDPHGRHLATPDLFDAEAGVIGEYDGPLHLVEAQRRRDEVREAVLREHGLEYVAMTAADHADPVALVARIHAAYTRAARIPESCRSWTLDQPAWWIDTSTVAARRVLTENQRDRVLRYRAG
ncbi:hypothetical protein ACT8ZV_22955 [Nocardioides sp. MAHUQ-72]|uniref:hypothetical protein n=1 Tax=unclassified Nocardioides TaxID=2615069 RepID=UPI00360D84D2